jgi:hypothetical protein
MGKKIYKYMGPEILDLAFSPENEKVGFKCSLPEDYNDPYELFLSVDRTLDPQLLAFYQESIGKIPQIPTTCFSNSPIVVPMWAHYAHTSRGFVVEIDEAELKAHFDEISICDVSYTDSPDESITPSLQRAFGTCKPRHTFFLHKTLMHAAYFSKQTCWNYEQERRVVVPRQYIDEINANMIFRVPIDCITAIISGSKTEPEFLERAHEIVGEIGCEYFRSFIGRSFPEKYMKDETGDVYIFNGEGLIKAPATCDECNEPIASPKNTVNELKCSWCAVSDSHRENAADNNPYRMLHDLGMLDEHVERMENIYRGKS